MAAHRAFPRSEYEDRWNRVFAAMAERSFDWLLVWQRGAGGYDRAGDVFWLTNFVMIGSGQDPASETEGAPYTFAALLIHRQGDVELHIGLPAGAVDLEDAVCTRVVSHAEHLSLGLAKYIRDKEIGGRVAVVGDDVLPGTYDRLLRKHTPQIEWVSQETLLLGPQRIKSDRELDVYRCAGALLTSAMTGLMEHMRAGGTGAEAAARAASILLAGGGGYHRIDVTYGARAERQVLSASMLGYDATAPTPGELFRAWIFGPILQGYWLDPGRTAVSARPPTAAQRVLIEGAAEIVDSVLNAMRPGITARELGRIGGKVAHKHGYFESPQFNVPLLGHGVATNFIPYWIPIGDGPPDPDGDLQLDVPLVAGMVMTAEVFLTHPGVGTAGFEQVVIVTPQGTELLTQTPMLYD